MALVVSSFLLSNVWAKCQDTKIFSAQVGYGSNSVQALTDVADPAANTVSLPLIHNGSPSCYHQSAPLILKTENVVPNVSAEFELTPLQVEFENIPKAALYQYIHVEQSEADNNPKILILNFLCSGNHPIGADALADYLKDMADKNETRSEPEFYISTGETLGDDYLLNPKMKAKSKIYDAFVDLYDERNTNGTPLEISSVYIPNVISGLSQTKLTPMERKLYSTFFARTGSSVNGCHPDFIAKMQDKLIENVVKNQPFSHIDIRKKFLSSKFKMKWEM